MLIGLSMSRLSGLGLLLAGVYSVILSLKSYDRQRYRAWLVYGPMSKMDSTLAPALALASHQQQQSRKTPDQSAAQNLLSEARAKLKLENAEATRAVVDPSETKPP